MENKRLFWISFAVFLSINLIENLLHYTIGRESDKETYHIGIEPPTKIDWAKIIIIMAIFASLQGALTMVFYH